MAGLGQVSQAWAEGWGCTLQDKGLDIVIDLAWAMVKNYVKHSGMPSSELFFVAMMQLQLHCFLQAHIMLLGNAHLSVH